MRPFLPLLLGLAAALLLAIPAACGGDDDGTGTPTAIPVDDFCAALVTATCERAARCGCDAVVPELATQCPMGVAARCPVDRGTPLRDAIDAGDAIWDGDAAARLIARLDGGPCEALACAGTRACLGLSDEGGPCEDASLGCVAEAVCIDGTCVRPAPDGDACTASGGCRSGRCVGDICEAKAALGEGCAEDPECETGRCDFATGRCGALIIDGELCTESSDCASGYCDIDLMLGAGACRPLRADGTACDEDLACAGGACVGMICAPSACDEVD